MATSHSVRYINARRVLDRLFREGPCSRAELARNLGMTRSAVGSIIADLIETGLVIEAAAPAMERQRTGRPSLAVSINPEGGHLIGAEIGVDRLSVVVLDMSGQVLFHRVEPHDTPEHAPTATIDALVALVRDQFDRPDIAGPLRGICVTLPAFMTPDGTVVNGLLLAWRDVPLRRLLVERLGDNVPLAIENDANAFALAEIYGRPGNRNETHAFLLIEVGVGGGIVIDGELFRGSGGIAGEFGQTVLGGRGFYSTGRPRPGHTESYVGREALLARWQDCGGPPGAEMDGFLAALQAGQPAATAAAGDWGRQLGLALVQITTVLNPTCITLGGSVSPVFPHVAEIVAEIMSSELLEGYPVPPVVVSQLGVIGPALGAASLMHQRLFRIENDAVYGLLRDDRIA